jgi:hypothetical protein
MSGRVVFFPLKHSPSQEKLDELMRLQASLYYSRISFLNAIRRESLYDQAVAHERLRSLIRSRLRIISAVSSEAD